MKPEFIYFMDLHDYIYIGSNIQEYHIFFHLERGFVNAVQFLEYNSQMLIDEAKMEELDQKMKDMFIQKGISEVHTLTVLVSPGCEDIWGMMGKRKDIWFWDSDCGQLIIPEGSREDFYGLKGLMNSFIHDRERYQEEAQQVIHRAEEKQKADNRSHTQKFFDTMKTEEFRKNFPIITALLVVTNIVVFIICQFTGDTLYMKGCFDPVLASEGRELYRFFTAIFLHLNIAHIFNNMLILYYIGSMVEQEIGKLRYGILCFLSGFFSMLSSMIYSMMTNSIHVSIGASGMVFGVVGALLWLVIEHKGKLKTVTIGRAVFAVLYSVYSGVVSENVDNAAHVGGLVTGFLLTFIMWLIVKLFHKMKRKERHQ